MKNDYSFKFVAAIVLAGVIVAFVSPTHAVNPSAGAKPEVALTAGHTE